MQDKEATVFESDLPLGPTCPGLAGPDPFCYLNFRF